jgi:hypothetical protein
LGVENVAGQESDSETRREDFKPMLRLKMAGFDFMTPQQNQEANGKLEFKIQDQQMISPKLVRIVLKPIVSDPIQIDVFAPSYTVAQTIAQQIIDALNANSEWVRVSERLPEPLKLVLICNITGVWFGCYSAKFDEWWDHDDAIFESVTHWRELPTPPKDL